MTIADLSNAVAALHLLRPQWLWALLALPVLVIGWQLRRRRQSAWRGAVDAHLLPHLLESRAVARRQWAPWLLALAYALGIAALAGPSWQRGVQPLLQSQAPLVIALDLSGATLANDLPPSRLAQARAKLDVLLKQRAGGQSGLIAFADDAYTVAPLTDDAANVALFLDALTPDVMPVDGSNAARAIARAVALMAQAGFDSGDILIVSDHADDDARDAAAEALAKGYRVSALGLGSDAGAAYRLPDGRIERTRLDAASLQAMVSAGGGRYAALSVGTADLDALGVLRAGAAGRQDESQGEAVTVWRDGGYWLLPPLMLLALLAFRRGGAFAVVLVCALLPAQALRADGGPSVAGGTRTSASASTTTADGSLWRRADQAQHGRMVEGEAAYRKKDYAAAVRAWRAVPGADAAYNRGNALAQAGRYDEAIAAYDQALRQQPAMADAIANRAAVDAARKRKPPPGKGSKSGKPEDGKDGKQGGQSDAKDSPSDQPSGQQEGQGTGQPPSRGDAPPPRRSAPTGQPPPPDGNSPDDPDRAQNQRQADAAQREQMGRELDRQAKAPAGQAEKQIEGEPRPSETPRQREQRQANDAWLRRVPDDPGGLLRAKFRLEYERRQQTGEP